MLNFLKWQHDENVRNGQIHKNAENAENAEIAENAENDKNVETKTLDSEKGQNDGSHSSRLGTIS